MSSFDNNAWTTDPNHPFVGIAEKLKRVDQNIVNLNTEITAFIDQGGYPTLPHPDDQCWPKAVDYHRNKSIPLRFSVLSGEIVHHLRSALDHIVWYFSSEEARLTPHNIEFPVFDIEPLHKKKLARYEGKIQGVKNVEVRRLIKEAQPYNAGPNVADDPILIVHNMDRFDKHRELVIVDSGTTICFPPEMANIAMKVRLYLEGKLPESEQSAARRAVIDHAKVVPQVAFRQFGQREYQPLATGLAELQHAIFWLADLFAREV